MKLLADTSTIDIREGVESLNNNSMNLQTDTAPLIARFINGAVVVGALLFLLYLILGAISWVTSGGDKGKVEGARNKMIQAFVGLVLLVFSYGIYLAVLNFLDINPDKLGNGLGITDDRGRKTN